MLTNTPSCSSCPPETFGSHSFTPSSADLSVTLQSQADCIDAPRTMDTKSPSIRRPGRTVRYLVIALIVPLLLLLFSTVRFKITGHFNGLFLLKGLNNWKYELKDDLYVGNSDRIVCGIGFNTPNSLANSILHPIKPGKPHLSYTWDAKEGSGSFNNFLADGTQLVTYFGRFEDSRKENVHGLFVGGGAPETILGNNDKFMNKSGMTFFDGRRWNHCWCNANEGIFSQSDLKPQSPSQWKFIGSEVIQESTDSVVVSSNHEVEVDGIPLRIDRMVSFNAGDTYFVLTIKITNIGNGTARYNYVYGDEPWVGNYGSSAGNVGWVNNRIINYEMQIDSSKYTYAGFYDYGNSAINEGRNFTKTATFIEWLGSNKPEVYFSNDGGILKDATGAKKIPLSSNGRFIGLEWRNQQLSPRQATSYTLAIGMAGHDPRTGFPVKPVINLASVIPQGSH